MVRRLSYSENDDYWTEELEGQADCGERGYQGLLWLKDRSEENIMVVSHGGILKFCMVDHPLVQVIDNRPTNAKRFGNCELREYEMTWTSEIETDFKERPTITLTEIMHS